MSKSKEIIRCNIALVKPGDIESYQKVDRLGWRDIDIFRRGMESLLKGKKAAPSGR